MCNICSCIGWIIDMAVSLVTWILGGIMILALCMGFIAAIAAGVAYGYNYSVAEFMFTARQDTMFFAKDTARSSNDEEYHPFQTSGGGIPKLRAVFNHDDKLDHRVTETEEDESYSIPNTIVNISIAETEHHNNVSSEVYLRDSTRTTAETNQRRKKYKDNDDVIVYAIVESEAAKKNIPSSDFIHSVEETEEDKSYSLPNKTVSNEVYLSDLFPSRTITVINPPTRMYKEPPMLKAVLDYYDKLVPHKDAGEPTKNRVISSEIVHNVEGKETNKSYSNTTVYLSSTEKKRTEVPGLFLSREIAENPPTRKYKEPPLFRAVLDYDDKLVLHEGAGEPEKNRVTSSDIVHYMERTEENKSHSIPNKIVNQSTVNLSSTVTKRNETVLSKVYLPGLFPSRTIVVTNPSTRNYKDLPKLKAVFDYDDKSARHQGASEPAQIRVSDTVHSVEKPEKDKFYSIPNTTAKISTVNLSRTETDTNEVYLSDLFPSRTAAVTNPPTRKYKEATQLKPVFDYDEKLARHKGAGDLAKNTVVSYDIVNGVEKTEEDKSFRKSDTSLNKSTVNLSSTEIKRNKTVSRKAHLTAFFPSRTVAVTNPPKRKFKETPEFRTVFGNDNKSVLHQVVNKPAKTRVTTLDIVDNMEKTEEDKSYSMPNRIVKISTVNISSTETIRNDLNGVYLSDLFPSRTIAVKKTPTRKYKDYLVPDKVVKNKVSSTDIVDRVKETEKGKSYSIPNTAVNISSFETKRYETVSSEVYLSDLFPSRTIALTNPPMRKFKPMKYLSRKSATPKAKVDISSFKDNVSQPALLDIPDYTD